ncbi:hypothetical protein HWC80_gp013 [Mycobacterium phage Indlulamithi]|uniref:Uncharacterized protein n=1 Tax=Mycobacterium phage Indlulamithi TaxID=2656582 RepID=A0A649VCW7_9CAUD|nr:hypothetical protein HWC80_gp013 [Mycobacterium phage Indlulamithi]QGJ90054.1 hypothetical protein PBI_INDLULAMITHI_13 [Mycobacterium phage Indlulamithi]
MAKTNRDILEFLLAGPLFSIFKVLNRIRRDIVGLRETLQGYNDRLDRITSELRDDFQRLRDQLANVSVPEDVSDVLASLDSKISALEGLDQPDPAEPVETTTPTGGVVLPPTSPEPDETTAASPGEPFTTDDSGNVVPVEDDSDEESTEPESSPGEPAATDPVTETETPAAEDDSETQ